MFGSRTKIENGRSKVLIGGVLGVDRCYKYKPACRVVQKLLEFVASGDQNIPYHPMAS